MFFPDVGSLTPTRNSTHTHMNRLLLTLLLAMSLPGIAQTKLPAPAIRLTHSVKEAYVHPLLTLVNNTRALLIFSPTSSDPRFEMQFKAFEKHSQEMADRNLILIPLLGTWRTTDSALRNDNVPFTDDKEQKYARTRLHIAPTAFTVILLGKDGGEKFRFSTPVTPDQLFQLIDAMPMRQQEMRNRTPPVK